MELKTFVEQSIVQIVEGVKSAQDLVEKDGAEVNPRTEGGKKLPTAGYDTSSYKATTIEFDVAVTAKDEASGQAGIKVWGVGVGGDLNTSNTVVSRIQFSLDVALPNKAG